VCSDPPIGLRRELQDGIDRLLVAPANRASAPVSEVEIKSADVRPRSNVSLLPRALPLREAAIPQVMKESGATLQSFLSMLPAMAWRATPDGTRDFHNQAWHDYTGLSLAQEYGCGWQSAVDPVDMARMLKDWEVIRKSEKSGGFEARCGASMANFAGLRFNACHTEGI
jgi:PAS domain-containing protein